MSTPQDRQGKSASTNARGLDAARLNRSAGTASTSDQSAPKSRPPMFEQLESMILLSADFMPTPDVAPSDYGQFIYYRSLQSESLAAKSGAQVSQNTGGMPSGVGGGSVYRANKTNDTNSLSSMRPIDSQRSVSENFAATNERTLAGLDRRVDEPRQSSGGGTETVDSNTNNGTNSPVVTPPTNNNGGNNNGGTSGNGSTTTPNTTTPPPGGPWQPNEYRVPGLDLQVIAVNAPATASKGQTISLSWTVRNNGSNTITGDGWHDAVYYSPDAMFDPTDVYVTSRWTREYNPLAPGQQYTYTRDVEIPADAVSDGYLLVLSDRWDRVPETNETNNTMASSRINLSDAPDAPPVDNTTVSPPGELPEGFEPRGGGPGVNTAISAAQRVIVESGLDTLVSKFNDLMSLGQLAASLPFITQNDIAKSPVNIGWVLNLPNLIETQIVTPIKTYLATATPNSDGLVSALDGLAQTIGAVTGGLYNGGTELRFNLTFQSARTVGNLPINVGTGADALGLKIDASASAQLSVQANVAYSFSFGIDLTPGLGDSEAFFINSGAFTAGATITGTNLNFSANVGILDVNIVNGSFNLNAGTSIALTNPDGDAAGKITLSEIQGSSPSSLFNVSQTTATATGTLPLSATLGSFTFPGLPSLSLTANPFTGVAPTITPNGAFAEMANFKNISPVTLLSMVDQLGSMLDNLAGTSVMSTPIPFTQGETVGSVLDFAEAFSARISDALRDPQGVPIFDSAQGLATQLATILGLPVGTIQALYDATENRFSYRFVFNRTAAAENVPLDFSANLAPLGSVTTESRLSVTATVNIDMRVLFDVDALTSGQTIVDAISIQNASVTGGIALSLTSFTASARFGFLDINVGGGSASGNANITLQLKDPVSGNVNIPVTIGTLLQRIATNPTSIVNTPGVTGSATLTLGPVSVLGNLLGTLTGSPTITISLPNLTSAPTLSFNADFNPILSFRDMDVGDVAAALGSFATYLQTLSGFSFLNYKLPFLNKSVSEMLSFASDFSSMSSLLNGTGALVLQNLENELDNVLSTFAIPGTSTITFTQTPIRALRIDLGFQKEYAANLPFNFNVATLAGIDGVSIPATIQNLISGSGTIAAQATINVDLDLGIDLTNPLSPRPFIYDTTGMALTAQASGTNLNFSVAAGPLGVFIRNGNVTLGPAAFSVQVNDNPGGGGRWYLDSIGTGQVTVTLTGTASANLPIDFPIQGVSVGAITLSMTNLGLINASTVDLTLPNFQSLINGLNIDLNMTSLVDGLDFIFGVIDGAIAVGGLASRLPIVGDEIGQAVQVIQQFKNNVITPLRNELASGDLLRNEVRTILFNAFGPSGLNILQDNAGAGGAGVTIDDVIVTTADSDNNGVIDDIKFDVRIGRNASASTGTTQFDLGLDAIGLSLGGSVNLGLGWNMNLVMGLSLAEGGAYFDVSNNRNDLTLSASATIPGFNATGNLLILEASARDNPATPTNLTAGFSLDIREPAGSNNNGKLSFNELISSTPAQIVSATFNATAHIDLLLTLQFGPNANFPSLGANLVVDWTLTNASVGTPSVQFKSINVNMGEFFSRFVGPIIDKIQTITEPLQPIIDVLNTPIPVINDLVQLIDPGADPVTMLTLAAISGVADTQFIGAITDVFDLITIINGINVGPNVTINLGQFNLNGLSAGNLQTPGFLSNYTIPGGNASPLSGLSQLASNPATSAFAAANGAVDGGGLQFPFLENPLSSLFPLLLGQDVTIFRYDAPKLAVSFSFRQSFPIIGPIVATLGGRLEAGIDVDFGYDTYGARRFVQTGNALELLNGFYIEDKVGGTSTGQDKFEAYLSGEIAAGGGVDIFVASVGVEGGVFATIGLDLKDPDNDGKFRFKNVIDAGSPLCIFTLGGELGAFLRAYATVGVWPFKVEFSFDIARVTLVTFNFDPCADPPVLASLDASGVLRLNMGPRAGLRGSDFTTDNDERFTVTRLTNFSVLVESDFGENSQYTKEFGTAQNPVTSIVADGGNGNDTILINPGITLPTTLTGGIGDDTLQGGNGIDNIQGNDGNDVIKGNAGADTLSGGNNNDEIRGGLGGDNINGDDGDDTIFGGDDPANIDDADTIFGGLGNDTIQGGMAIDNIDAGPGQDVVRGGAGNDILRGGNDPDAIYGDDGDDQIEGGSGDDILEGGSQANEAGVVPANSGNDTILGEAGNDTIRGRDGNDNITGGLDNDTVYGDEGDDTINTNEGADNVFGGSGNDIINLGSGNDTAQGDAGIDTIHGDDGNDTIRGGADNDNLFGDLDNDTMYGDDGNDTMEGGVGLDTMSGGIGNDNMQGQADADLIYGQEGNDTIFGGTGADTIYGSFGSDIIRGDDGNDLIYADNDVDDVQGNQGDDTIFGGTGNDVIVGNTENDTIRGGTGDDNIRGNDGNDFIYGDAGVDTIYGDLGNDTIEGNAGNDFLRGQDGNDNIRGNEDNDFIEGNAGIDTIFGDDGQDVIYGGLADDVIQGGANTDRIYGEEGNDNIQGNTGDDVIYGGVGNDTLAGNENNDQLYGEAGVDIITGDAGNDTIVAGSGIGDNLSGGDGDDTIYGSDEGADTDPNFGDAIRFGDVISGGIGNDTIYANGGADSITGDAGDDRIEGGFGADLIQGGDDNDFIYAGESTGDDLRGDAGDDTIYGSFAGADTIQGGTGNDVIFGQGNNDNIQGNAGDDVIDAGTGTDTVTGGDGNDEIYGGGGVGDNLSGDNNDDVIYGSDDGADIITGGAGRDRIQGRGGNDNISGGADDDILQGGAGDDTISGDAGSDLITGDANHDILYGHSVTGTGDDNAVDYLYGDFGTNGAEANQGRDQLFGNGGNDQLFGEGDDDIIRQGAVGSPANNPDAYIEYGTGDGGTPTNFVPPTATGAPTVQPGTPLITFGASLANGTTTTGRFIELAGSASQAGVSTSRGLSQDAVSVVAANGDVFTAWSESQNGSFEIYVARFSGGVWTQLNGSASGGGISNTSGASRTPTIALDGNNPVVAWAETDASSNTNIRVARFDGTNWVAYGTSLSAAGISATNLAESPKIVMNGTTPIVAWIDRTSGVRNVFVRRFTGGTWQEMSAGSATTDGLSNSTLDVESISLATNGTNSAIGWTQQITGQDREIYLLEWNGTAWNAVGGSNAGGGLSNNSTESTQPSVAYLGSTLYVAWTDNSLDASSIYVARFTAGSWQAAGASSNAGTGVSGATGRVSNPSLASNGTTMHLAWIDNTVNNRTIPRAAVYSRVWNNTNFAEQLIGDARNEGVSLTGGEVQSLHVSLNATGQPVVSWTDSTSGRPEAFVRYNNFTLGNVFYVNDASLVGDIFATAIGSGSNAGTSPAIPALSITQILANNNLNPGDIILVDSGSYTAFTVSGDDAGVTIRGGLYGASSFSGASNIDTTDVTMTGLSFATLNINAGGTRTTVLSSSTTGGVVLTGTGNAKVLQSTLNGGVTIAAATTNASISQNTITSGSRGVYFNGAGSTGNLVADNFISNTTTGIEIATATGATITGNTLTTNATGISVQAALTGTIASNRVTGGTVGLRYNASANVVGNTFTGATTGAISNTPDKASALGFVGAGAANIFSNASIGVQLTGWMQNQRILNNTTGVIGSGILGPDSLALPNLIEGNTVGTDFSGTIQFNRIFANATGIDPTAGQVIVHNLIYRNTLHGIDANGVIDVRIVSNTIDAPVGNAVTVRGTSSQVEVRGNILWADTGYAMFVDNNSQSGFASERNTLYATGAGKIAFWTKDFTDILDFKADVAKFDLASQGRTVVDPLWSQPRFLNRTFARYDAFDVVAGRRFSSPTVDTGDITADQGVQTERVNLLANPSFETGLTGWTTNLGASVRTTNPAPHLGTNYYYAGNDASGFAEQTINLVTAGFSTAQLDSQDFVLVFGGRVRSAAEASNDRGSFIVRFLDGVGGEINVQSLPGANVTDRWELLGSRLAIPSGTRSVVYRFVAARVTGTTNDAYFDSGFAYVLSENYGTDQGAYGNTTQDTNTTQTTHLAIVAPDLYVDWERNRPQTIIWNSFGNTADLGVNIDLYRDTVDGPELVLSIATNTPDVGSFQWQPGNSGVAFGTFNLRIQVSLSGNQAVTERSTERFTVPEDGTTYYVDDLSNTNDEYTPGAIGNNRATGKLATTPKPNPVNVIRTYDLQNGSVLNVDTGTYPLIDTFIGTGIPGIGFGTDRAFSLLGPTNASRVAEFVTAIPNNANQSLIELFDADFMTIRDLTLTGGKNGLNLRQGTTDLTAERIVVRDNFQDGVRVEENSAFTVLRNFTVSNHPGNFDGVVVSGGAGGLIENLTSSGSRIGLYLNNAAVTINGANIFANRLNGIYKDGSNPGGTWTGVNVHHNLTGGIRTEGDVTINNSTIDANTGLGLFQQFSTLTINNSIISNNTLGGIDIDTAILTGNRFVNNAGAAVGSYNNGLFVTMTDNEFSGNQYGFYTDNGFSGGFALRNNTFFNHTTAAIRVINGSNANTRTIINNTIDEPTADAIRVSNTRNITLRNNVIWTRTGYGVYIENDSQVGFTTNFNLLRATGTGKTGFYQGDRVTLTDWQFATFQDADSLSADPLFVNPTAGNYRLQSTFGSYDPVSGTFVFNAANSPAIDRGDPLDAFNLEPASNGGYINLGAEGNTAEASKSPAQYVKVTNPNGTELLPQNSTFNIRWRSFGFAGNVKIEVSSNGVAGPFNTLSANEANDGSYLWNLATQAISDQYVIRISSVSTPAIVDTSDALFSVGVPINIYYVDDASDVGDEFTPGAVGNDANSGQSPLAPKASIRAILQQYDLEFGDIIRVDTGNYTLTANILIDAQDAGVRIEGPTSGTGALINRANTTSSAQRAFELLDADAVTLSRLRITGAWDGVYVGSGSSGVVIENVEAFENAATGINVADAASSGVIVRDSIFWGTWGDAARDQNDNAVINSNGSTILRNKFYHVNGQGGSGLYLPNNSGHAIVQNNEAWNNDTGISVRADSFDVSNNIARENGTGMYFFGNSVVGTPLPTASNNTAFNSYREGFYIDSRVLLRDSIAYDNVQEGAEIRNGAQADNLTLYRNGTINTYNSVYIRAGSSITNSTIFNSPYGIYSDGGGGTVTIQGNRIFNTTYSYGIGASAFSSTNIRILNNLIYDTTGPGIYLADSSGTPLVEITNNTVYNENADAVQLVNTARNNTFKNNILIGGGSGKYAMNVADSAQLGFASDYNLLRAINGANLGFWQAPFANLTDWSLELGFDANSISTDPRFVDIDGTDNIRGAVDASGLAFQGWNNINFSGAPAVTAVDRVIDFSSSTGIRPGLNVDGTSMRWSGEVFLPSAGNYTFAIRALGPQRLFVNGGLLINDFAAPSNLERTGVFTAAAPGWVSIVFEAVDDTSTTQPRLRWSRPGDGTLLTNITGGYLRTSATPLNQASDDNFRLQSAVASYKPTGPTTGSWSADLNTSPAIDAGNPTDQVFEDAPINLVGPLTQQDGDRVDLGAYGNSNSASRSAASYIQLLTPGNNAKYQGGKPITVTWRSEGVSGFVNILLSQDGGANYDILELGVLDDGEYTFTLTPTSPLNNLKLLIQDASDDTIVSESVSSFSVGVATNIYYVNDTSNANDVITSATGNNSNTGTTASDPMRSLSALLASYDLEAGDVILVDTGTYQLIRNIVITAEDAGISIQGPSSGPGAVIDRDNPSDSAKRAFELLDADAVTLSRLRITGAWDGVYVGSGSSGVVIENVEAFENAATGINVADAASSGVIVRDSIFWGTWGDAARDQNDNAVINSNGSTILRNKFYHVNGQGGSGLYLPNNSGHAIVQNNEAWNNDTGISVRADSFDVSNNIARENGTGMYFFGNSVVGTPLPTASNNTAFNSYREGFYIDSRVLLRDSIAYDNVQEGAEIRNGAQADNLTLYRNGTINTYNSVYIRAGSSITNSTIFNSPYGIYSDGGGGTVTIQGNRIFNTTYSYGIGASAFSSTNIRILNNLIYDTTGPGIYLADSSGTPLVEITNNTVYNENADAVQLVNTARNNTFKNNILIGGGSGKYAMNVADSAQLGFASDYNLLRAINGANLGFWQAPFANLTDWSLELGFDANSISTDPRFVDIDGTDNIRGAVDASGLAFQGWNNINFSGAPAVTAVDRVIDFSSSTGIRPGLNVDGTSMRWSGEVFLPSAGNYTFAIRALGPQRLFVNGGLLINDFAAPSNLERTGVFTAAAPGWVSIVFEAVDDTSTTQPRLRWSRPGDGTLLTNITGGYLRTSATPLNQASDDNFRLQSAVASYKPTGPTTGSWSADLNTSPAIDAGNPTDQVFEDAPINLVGPLTQQDGDRVDLGAYGNSNSASRSAANIVQILSPDGGEKARADRTFSIRWRSVSAGQRVNIEFSPNNGATWSTIGTNELNDGVFAWTPTAANQTLQGLIRITSTTIPSATDTSVDVFTVGTSGTNYYVNNNSTTGDQYTTTTGSNLNTGTTPADPMSSLNALLAAYDINPGDIIYVDAGTYNQPSTIQLLSQDIGATILGPTGANVAIINRGNVSTDVAAMRVNANDVTIRNLQFTGGYIGLWGVNAQRLLLEDVTAFNNANVGVQIDISSSNLVARRIVAYGTTASVNTDQNYDMFLEGANALVENSQFYKVGTRSGYGFRAQGNATGLLLRNNLAYNNDAGLSVDVAQFTVHSNEVRGNNVGMETRDSADVDRSEVYNNYIHDNATGATVYERIIFRNNNVTLNTTAGINGLQYGSSIIRDNLISLNGDGIINRYHTILNNRIVGNTNRGILIDLNSNSIIEGNQILGSSVGIRIQNTNSASTNLIINNLIYDNTNQAVDLDYSATTNSTFRLINNTIYHQVGSAVRIVNAITGSQMVNNNIAIGGGFGVELSGTIGAWLSNYNNVWLINSGSAQYGRFQGTPQNTIVNWRTATSQDANSKSADALFIDFNGADNLLGWDRLSPSDPFQDFGIDDNLRVLASSPVIDSADSTLAPALDADGLARVDDLGTINQGNGVFRFYDIGAYEFQGSGNDTTPPVITNLAPVGNVNDVIVTAAVPSFTVTFSERMDPTSVRSLALYRLIEAGVDGNFDTGDDVPFTVSGVSYTFGSLTATINLPSTLPDGYYRLRITSDVGNAPVDLAGNRLDGDNNGTQGGDFNRRFRVDRTGPTVLSVTPNTAVQVGPTSFVIQLAAATDLNVASILNTANYTLLKSIDRTFGNGDDTNVSSRIININFNAPLFRVTLTLNAALEQANYRLVLGAGIVDNVGNPLTGAPYNSDLSVDSTRPTPTLASPFSSGVTGADFGYVDINWNDGNGSGVNPASVVPTAVTISGVTVTTVTNLGGGVFRYNYTGSLTQGTINVTAAANAVTDFAGNTSLAATVGSFVFDTAAPTGQLVSPANGATITNNPGFIDVRWQDIGGSGINASSIDAGDITITGVTVTGVTNQGGGVFRYSYSGTLPFSNISVNVVANQVRDNANRAIAAGVVGTFTRIVPGPRVTSASVDDAAKSLTINFSGTPSNIQTLINNGQITTAIRLFTASGTQITLTANRFTWNAATQRLVINLRVNQSDPFSPSILTTQGQYQLRFTTASITDSSGNQLVDTDGTSDGTLNRNFYWTNSSGDIGPA